MTTTRDQPTAQAPLKVVLVSTRRDWGGGEQQAWLLAQGLRERGHSCRVLARRGGLFAERLAADRFAVEVFPGSGRSPLALWQIRRQLTLWRPDVVHANDAHAVSAAGLATLGLPVSVRVASRRVAFPLRSPYTYERACDRVICVAQAVADVCYTSGLPRHLLRVAHSGNRPEFIQSGDRKRGRESLGLDEKTTLLLTVANLSPNKGHQYLLDALPAVLKKHPHLHLALAGRGDLREPLQEQAERLGIAEHVHFLGYRDDVPDLLAAADLFVMPSLAEGICGVLAEALLAGCPVVGTTADGMSEVIGRGDEPANQAVAWPVPAADTPQLTAAILAALDSPRERAARAARGRTHALAHFTADRMVEANLAVYREVFAEKQAAGRTPSAA